MKPLTPPPFAPNGAAGLLATGEDAHPAIVWHDGHVGYGALRDAVARAAACVPDANGVSSVAFFYVADDAPAVQARLVERIATLPPHERPASMQALHELPRTATGKLLRRQLLAAASGVPA